MKIKIILSDGLNPQQHTNPCWEFEHFFCFKVNSAIIKIFFIFIYLFKEEKVKTKLNKDIRGRKKTIYRSLMETVEENMKDCYQSKNNNDCMQPVTVVIFIFIYCNYASNLPYNVWRSCWVQRRGLTAKHEGHDWDTRASKDTKFDQAKDEMLKLLKELMVCLELFVKKKQRLCQGAFICDHNGFWIKSRCDQSVDFLL